jgi:prevent-host-death family protein
MIFTVQQAKTHLSELLTRAEAGEEVVIARRGKPLVRLVVAQSCETSARIPGAWKGKFDLPDGFFDPLTEDELALWEGGDA